MELIAVDDALVDIIIGFWELGIDTIHSCSGHLYFQQSFPFSMNIAFFAFQFDEGEHDDINEQNLGELKQLRGTLQQLNINDEFDISEIKQSPSGEGYECRFGYTMQPDDDMTGKDRLKIQNGLIFTGKI